METIVCKCRVITPMFSSGADQKTCEIRVPEIKAAMRFWWRAAHSNLSPDELRKKETLIFGGSGDEDARKSSFTMRVENARINYYGQKEWDSDLKNYKVAGTRQGQRISVGLFDYLAYGVAVYDKEQRKNLLQRAGIAPESKFDLIVCVDKEFKTDVEESLNLFSCFGAVGSKSRNGFGKIVIDKMDTNFEKLCNKYCVNNDSYPEYTAFGQYLSVFRTKKSYGSWHEALFQIGKAYREARIGEHATEGLLGDHHSGENRQYVALPLTIDRKDVKDKSISISRMTKQFFMIVEPENGGFRGYILHLPFNFEKFGNIECYENAYDAMIDSFNKNQVLERR